MATCLFFNFLLLCKVLAKLDNIDIRYFIRVPLRLHSDFNLAILSYLHSAVPLAWIADAKAQLMHQQLPNAIMAIRCEYISISKFCSKYNYISFLKYLYCISISTALALDWCVFRIFFYRCNFLFM